MSKKSWLTPQQRTFARAYVKTSDAGKASREAGYHTNAGHLLEWPAVRDLIEVLQRNAGNRACLSIDKILNDLEDVRIIAMEKGQMMIALKALEMQGKHLGMWKDSSFAHKVQNETVYNVNFIASTPPDPRPPVSKEIDMGEVKLVN